VRGYVGLWLQEVTEDLVKALGLENKEGVLVADVVENGPADRAGIKRGDVIVSYEGKKIEDGAQLKNMVAQTEPGAAAKAVIIRDGQKKEVNLKLTERKEGEKQTSRKKTNKKKSSSRNLGFEIQELTSDIAEQLGFVDEIGVVIAHVFPGTPASEAGLRRGDLIQEVNRRPVQSEEEFDKAIEDLKGGDILALLVRRGQNTFFVTLKIPEK
jgi:serine protease Do